MRGERGTARLAVRLTALNRQASTGVKRQALQQAKGVLAHIFLRDCPRRQAHLDLFNSHLPATFEDVDEFRELVTMCQQFASGLKTRAKIPEAFLEGGDEVAEDIPRT